MSPPYTLLAISSNCSTSTSQCPLLGWVAPLSVHRRCRLRMAWLVVGGGWWLVVGSWRLVVGDWWSLGAVLNKKKTGVSRTALSLKGCTRTMRGGGEKIVHSMKRKCTSMCPGDLFRKCTTGTLRAPQGSSPRSPPPYYVWSLHLCLEKVWGTRQCHAVSVTL